MTDAEARYWRNLRREYGADAAWEREHAGAVPMPEFTPGEVVATPPEEKPPLRAVRSEPGPTGPEKEEQMAIRDPETIQEMMLDNELARKDPPGGLRGFGPERSESLPPTPKKRRGRKPKPPAGLHVEERRIVTVFYHPDELVRPEGYDEVCLLRTADVEIPWPAGVTEKEAIIAWAKAHAGYSQEKIGGVSS